MTTRIRTWILLSGLTALFVSLGALVGGPSGLVLFLAIAVVVQRRDVLVLGAARAEDEQGPPARAG